MKKLVGIAAVAACLSMVGVEDAKASGPYYLSFKDYCDCLVLRTDVDESHVWIVGTWDWKCDGTSLSLVHGIKNPQWTLGTQPVEENGRPAGFSATLALEGTSGFSDHADVTATFDGLTNVPIAEEADYFMRKTPCGNNGKPPLFP